MSELKPCAHCANLAIVEERRYGDFSEWAVQCSCCLTRSDYYGSREAAIAAWNTRADEPQIIKNASYYNLADDSKPQIIATGEKHKSADKPDSREQLEDDALDLASRIWHRGCYYGEGNCDIKSAAWDENDVIAMLERQAAITERECMERATSERVGWDCAECAEGLRKRVDELTADAKRWADAANGQRLVAMEQADKVCELTAERDRLQRVVKVQADSFQKLERENRELQDACGELERTVKNLRGME